LRHVTELGAQSIHGAIEPPPDTSEVDEAINARLEGNTEGIVYGRIQCGGDGGLKPLLFVRDRIDIGGQDQRSMDPIVLLKECSPVLGEGDGQPVIRATPGAEVRSKHPVEVVEIGSRPKLECLEQSSEDRPKLTEDEEVAGRDLGRYLGHYSIDYLGGVGVRQLEHDAPPTTAVLVDLIEVMADLIVLDDKLVNPPGQLVTAYH
jgi:hypothetical protein